MSDQNYLEGQILIAMPGMGDPRFDRSVIYLCAHSDQGALGFVVNKTVDQNNVPHGTLVNFTITIKNLWDQPATNMVLTDILPAGLELVSASVSSAFLLGRIRAKNTEVPIPGLNREICTRRKVCKLNGERFTTHGI